MAKYEWSNLCFLWPFYTWKLWFPFIVNVWHWLRIWKTVVRCTPFMFHRFIWVWNNIHILGELFPCALNLKVFCPQASRDVPKAYIENQKGMDNEKCIDSKERWRTWRYQRGSWASLTNILSCKMPGQCHRSPTEYVWSWIRKWK